MIGTKLVLVVDDDPLIRSLLEAVLSSLGYKVLHAADGQSAWDILRASPVRLVITDWLMPSMDGLELCRRIRQELPGPYCYVLLFTKMLEHEALTAGFEAGADDFLRKPLGLAELRFRVEAAERMLVLQQQLEQRSQELAAASERTQGAFGESEALRLVALEAGRIGAWWWNTRDRTCRGDSVFLALFGQPPSEVPHPVEVFTRLVAPQSAAATEALMETPPMPGQELENDIEIVSGPSAGRWIRWRGRADPHDPALIRGIGFDITDQKRTEAALRESEEQLQLATEAAGLGIFDANLASGERQWDARLGEFWGLPAPVSITDEVFVAGVHPDDRALVQAAVARALDPNGDHLYAAEYRVLPLDGAGERWIAATGRVHFEGRQPVRLIGTMQDITERQRTEAALRESEERLQLATAAAGLGIFDADLTTGEIEWDPRMRELWGLGAEEVITDDIFIAGVHPDDRALVRAAVGRAFDPDGDHLYMDEYRVLPLDGSGERWMAATGRAHFDGRQPVRLVGTEQDITERKRTERALRESEERLQLATEAAGLGIFDVDVVAGKIGRIEWDARQRELWGIGADEVITDETFVAGVHPDDRAFVQSVLERSFDPDGSGRYVAEYRILPLDGSGQRWIAATARIHFEGREPVRLIGTARDISGRKQAEEALRESEERFRQFGEAASDMLWVCSADLLTMEYLSPASEAVYGIERDKLSGLEHATRWDEAILPEDREEVLSNLERACAGESVDYTFRFRHPSKSNIRRIRSTAFPLLDDWGRVRRVAGISRDVTEEVELQERLEVLVAELQHRTRNLLGVVRSLADKSITGSSSLLDFRARFRDRLDALARVNGLLSRLEEGGRITFEELLRIELMAHGAVQSTGHSTQVSLDGPKGVRLRSCMVQTLALALHELATNALKHGALSQPKGWLDVSWDLVEGQGGKERLRIEWRESGVPIPAALTMQGAKAPPLLPHRGFGRDLIERIVPHQLKAEISYDLGPDGLRCSITLPISTTMEANSLALDEPSG